MLTLTESWLQIMAGGGISAVVWLLGLLVRQLKELNSKISEMLLRETHREAEIETIKATIGHLPCVRAGFSCVVHSEIKER